ncbi:hypothetical protein KC19_1G067300 [Ceratodon purpureus]|uniref:Uncharacterized protein n=1 Tax=Ceratodon purpureus TaxID=3225 RepID=A0A8T0J4S2_CERPU|nr:hypothetical protein KC19_1G067300 [Ceratodon purpureus]
MRSGDGERDAKCTNSREEPCVWNGGGHRSEMFAGFRWSFGCGEQELHHVAEMEVVNAVECAKKRRQGLAPWTFEVAVVVTVPLVWGFLPNRFRMVLEGNGLVAPEAISFGRLGGVVV